jgi:hypothetical protein
LLSQETHRSDQLASRYIDHFVADALAPILPRGSFNQP